MKYDDTSIPTGYDKARERSPEVLASWATSVAAHVLDVDAVRTILDLGCGTGRFSGVLRSHFGATVVGVDPSSRMLRRARVKSRTSGFHVLVATGEAIPLKDDAVDLIFASMVLHHFDDVSRALAESRRVLRDGGSFYLRAATKERIPSYPTSAHFPASVAIMERALWTVDRIREAFESEGFQHLHTGSLDQVISPSHAAYAEQLAAGGDSMLAQLSRTEFNAGVASVRALAATVDPKPILESIDFLVFR